MAFHLLERERERGLRLAAVMEQAMRRIGHCERCRNFSEEPLCALCASNSRDRQVLCVVESPTDLAAIEQATGFRGQYRSEERRVGKACVSTCRSRGWPYN